VLPNSISFSAYGLARAKKMPDGSGNASSQDSVEEILCSRAWFLH
jgi:hypothetical protein